MIRGMLPMTSSNSLNRRAALRLIAGVPFFAGRVHGEGGVPRARLAEEVRNGFRVLDRLFWSPELSIWLDRPGNDLRACYEGRLNPPWWSSANAVETLTDYMQATGSEEWLPALQALHRKHRKNPDHSPELIAALEKRGEWTEEDARKRAAHPWARHSAKGGYRDFNNEYLDDSGWWGLAWLKLHRLTKEPVYLETAVAVHRHMEAHRLPDGGIIWNLEQQPPVTNAITNGLFLTLSARLFTATRTESYLKQARQTRQWMLDQKLWDGTGIVDGPGHQGDHWSYNQGMWILGLLALAEAAGEAGPIDEAAGFTRSLLEKGGFLTENVLTEKLSHTGWDTALFKGVLARALGELRLVLKRSGRAPDLLPVVERVLEASVSAVLAADRDA